MAWNIRHEGSPQARATTLPQIVEGLRDGVWLPTDEVQGPGESAWVAIENHPQLAEVAEELETPPSPAHDDEERVDMNALIDVCLVLLIFFMMTTTYAMAVQKTVPLPELKEDKATKKGIVLKAEQVRQQMIRIDAKLDAKGQPVVFVEGSKLDVARMDAKGEQTLDTERLTAKLREYVRGTPKREEVLLDAQGVTWGLVVAIQDAARDAGVRVVHHRKR
jgi:biopolymer transport protein ExbD